MLTRDEVIQLILYLIVATALLLSFRAPVRAVKGGGSGGTISMRQVAIANLEITSISENGWKLG